MQTLEQAGYAIVENMYTATEINHILQEIECTDHSRETFRKSAQLFAIRQFLKELPQLRSLIFNDNLTQLLHTNFGTSYTCVKSIYFDKPVNSNWYVAYHQDLTISVNPKLELPGFGPWTVKQDQFAVQPPVTILEDNITFRIHLDDTDADNGALRVVPGSHRKGIYRPENIDWSKEQEDVCNVRAGGVMLMRPLLLHSSSRTRSDRRRRVIHLEFSKQELPAGLTWAELSPPATPARLL